MELLDNEQYFNIYKSVCQGCEHFNNDLTKGVRCKAFKNGIPNEILLGENKNFCKEFYI